MKIVIRNIDKKTTTMAGHKRTCCHFCNTFRKGNEIEYLTLVDKGKNGNYKSKTITSCSDQEYCNEHILTMEPLIKFLKK